MFSYLDFLVPDVVGAGGGRLLHGGQTQDLEQMILHDVADDSKLVEISAPALGAEGLLEGDDHRRDVVPVPRGAEQHVGEAESHQILNHFFAQVMIDSIELEKLSCF